MGVMEHRGTHCARQPTIIAAIGAVRAATASEHCFPCTLLRWKEGGSHGCHITMHAKVCYARSIVGCFSETYIPYDILTSQTEVCTHRALLAHLRRPNRLMPALYRTTTVRYIAGYISDVWTSPACLLNGHVCIQVKLAPNLRCPQRL